MKKWECTICGYIHEGETPPDECPVCGADSDAFVELVEEQQASPTSEEATPQEPAAPAAQNILSKINELIMQFHLHPITVHTPNGIIPLAFIFLVIGGIFGALSFEQAAFYSLVFVLLNMPLVIYTGYTTWQQKYKGAMTSVFKIKIGASIVSTALLCVLIIWRAAQPDLFAVGGSATIIYILLALVLLGAVGIAGHLGGKLVFGSHK